MRYVHVFVYTFVITGLKKKLKSRDKDSEKSRRLVPVLMCSTSRADDQFSLSAKLFSFLSSHFYLSFVIISENSEMLNGH